MKYKKYEFVTAYAWFYKTEKKEAEREYRRIKEDEEYEKKTEKEVAKILQAYKEYYMSRVSIQFKIDMACAIAGLTQAELSKKIGTTPQAWNQRMKTGRFSDEDFNKIAEACGCVYKSGFYFPDGNKVE